MSGMDNKYALLRHFLAALAYRTRKALYATHLQILPRLRLVRASASPPSWYAT